MRVLISKNEIDSFLSIVGPVVKDCESINKIKAKVLSDKFSSITTSKFSICLSSKNPNNLIITIDTDILLEILSTIGSPAIQLVIADIRPTTRDKIRSLVKKRIRKIIFKFGLIWDIFK